MDRHHQKQSCSLSGAEFSRKGKRKDPFEPAAVFRSITCISYGGERNSTVHIHRILFLPRAINKVKYQPTKSTKKLDLSSLNSKNPSKISS